MGRYNDRSGGGGSRRRRSYSPRRSPPPQPRSRRYDDHRQRHRSPPAPSGLLVRNISLDSRPEDLRIPFERFGPVKDVYLPKNYYTGEPRGFGFVKFRNPEDASEAKHQLNHCVLGGHEITIVYAEENRKTPREMRTTTQTRRYGGSSGRQTPPRSSRRRSFSRSLSPTRHDSRDRDHRGRDLVLPPRSRSPSFSASPHDARTYKTRHYSNSPGRNGKGAVDKMYRGSDQTVPHQRSHDKRATQDLKVAVANEDDGHSRSLSR
uniref:serine/arginine-rich SC35-like splicing factor SCL28 isoform X2 n=1 Tax=Erigeron canadensis TaxID=72917 RepID=UPI001CB9758D|nr:serine/arginine-rich SC35-like splicing factor SCL28 isoform X2 [Erigeron canadensis]